MRRIVIPVVAVLVLGIATVAWARSGHRGAEHTGVDNGVDMLEEVLDELVDAGTITQEQSDAIRTALENKRTAALQARRELAALLKSLLEDDVLTSEEIAQLPFADRITDPDGPYADAMEDGQITKEELKQSRSAHAGRRGRWGGHGLGFKKASYAGGEVAEPAS